MEKSDGALSSCDTDRGRGGFFAVDRNSWATVCALGMNAAVAYLVLARGTGRDNRTTAWSTHAIEIYTGIARSRAKRAVEALLKADLARLLRSGSHPRYELVPVSEVKETKSGSDARPDWIWLPNELISGAADEVPPVKLVRQTQDVMTLRLLVDYYYAQNLREEGGIGRQFLWQEFERHILGQRAQLTIWGFRPKQYCVNWRGPTLCHRREHLTEREIAEGYNAGTDFFRRHQQLIDLGLIELVPYLFEGSDADAEIIHPVGMRQSANVEDRLGFVAGVAGMTLLTEDERRVAVSRGLWVLPVPRHMTNVQLIGISRLRYRPKTRQTAAWWAALNAGAERFLRQYSELATE